MLSCYPTEAYQQNWLHESIIELIVDVVQRIERTEHINNNQASWRMLLNVFPAEIKTTLIPLRGIRDRFFAFKDELLNLSTGERRVVLQALTSQNLISQLLDGTAHVNVIDVQLPKIHEKAKSLFVFCYEKLTDLGIREQQYEIVFESLDDKICPFCGIERVMNPEETAQDQDHYLAKSIYPFAAVNMKNLVPMCRCCNRDYKKDIDIIRDSASARRKAFDPYNCVPPDLCLNRSSVVPEISPLKFDWNIEFLTFIEESETWDAVFSIRHRYKRDVLDKHFDRWLGGLKKYCEGLKRKGLITTQLTNDQVKNYLTDYIENKTEFPNIGNGGFLEPLAYKYLLTEFENNNQRIVQFIREAVTGTPHLIAA